MRWNTGHILVVVVDDVFEPVTPREPFGSRDSGGWPVRPPGRTDGSRVCLASILRSKSVRCARNDFVRTHFDVASPVLLRRRPTDRPTAGPATRPCRRRRPAAERPVADSSPVAANLRSVRLLSAILRGTLTVRTQLISWRRQIDTGPATDPSAPLCCLPDWLRCFRRLFASEAGLHDPEQLVDITPTLCSFVNYLFTNMSAYTRNFIFRLQRLQRSLFRQRDLVSEWVLPQSLLYIQDT